MTSNANSSFSQITSYYDFSYKLNGIYAGYCSYREFIIPQNNIQKSNPEIFNSRIYPDLQYVIHSVSDCYKNFVWLFDREGWW